MNMRPVHACWFELLTTHDDLTDTLEALAHTGSIELEFYDQKRMQMDQQDLQQRIEGYIRLQRYYRSYWPEADISMSPFSGSAAEIMDKALDCLLDWETAVQPEIDRLGRVRSQLHDLRLLATLIDSDETSALDYGLFSMAGPSIVARLFLLPNHGRLEVLQETVLAKEYRVAEQQFLLLLGTRDDLDALSAELALKKYTQINIPALPDSRQKAVEQVKRQLAELEQQMSELDERFAVLSDKYHLSQALGELKRMDWFLKSIPALPVSKNFVWITGWSSDRSGNKLQKALALQGSRAILHFPEAPQGLKPPMMLHNPWWAKPFELFISMLGTPGRDEADPSRLLAVLVPLLFGYMFADVGQGMVLLIAGLLLQKRWPALRILVVNGASAMVFGLVFGSMFGREDIIPALWLHPLTQPLPVLAVPMLLGISVILLGLSLSAIQAHWRGEWLSWLHTGAPVILLYLGILMLLAFETAAIFVIACALTWYFAGSLLLARGKIIAVLISAGELLESMMQLMLNTLSFVRVGAFALAHAGLSMAFNIMADGTSSLLLSGLILLLGNVIVIMLEGLVVSIQTTRLILFEFFIRFMQANGRVFKPLAGPSKNEVVGSVNN